LRTNVSTLGTSTEGEQMSEQETIDLKAAHRFVWGLGDYHNVAVTTIPQFGPELVEACGIKAGQRVLDVAAGAGNVAIPAAARGAEVIASDLTPELFEAGRRDAEQAGVELEWVEADAENLPFGDAEFDVVTSSVGAVFAPDHAAVARELLRVCKPGGTVGLLSWTPEGMIGALFRMMKPFAPPPPPGASPPPLWGSEDHLDELFGERVAFRVRRRDMLEVDQFTHPHEYGEHFRERYGPTIAALNNARKNGQEDELLAAVDAFCDEWNLGSADDARFEQEYLLAVATKL
jgi:SAM-dependent methyltransferase